ncbi:glycosyltransferase family 2 protein [Patescibacteria group bacterium]
MVKKPTKLKPKPKISVIIVSYNRKEEILKLIDSLSRQTYPVFEIVIIDNASTNNPVPLIRKKYPQVKLTPLSKNTGFGATNLGLKKATGDLLMMLDNDVEVKSDLCQQVVAYFENNPEVGSLAFRINHYNSSHPRKIPHRSLKNKKGQEIWETTIINPGAGVIAKDLYEKIGGINADYFIYGNEFEYGARALEAGFKLRYEPAIVVRHKEAASNIRKSGKSSFFVGRNWIYFLYEFIPFRDLLDIFFFSSRAMVENSARTPQKTRHYLRGVMTGMLTCWQVIKKRRKLSGAVLKKVKAGILGTDGFVYPW